MKTNPLLEELWQVKEDLAREAGYEIDRIFAELRAAEASHPGPLICTAEELRRFVANQDRRLEVGSAFKETPPSASPKQSEGHGVGDA